MTRRVLFVDDDPQILEGLRMRLHRRRREWDLVFAGGAEPALALLDERPADVVVTDLRMPGTDGAALLEAVQERYPHTARIVLSGDASVQTALRAINVAHQFLTKPCEPGVLENVIERVCAVHALAGSERMRRIVGRVEHLPSPPGLYTRLKTAIGREFVTAGEVADILKQDVAICAKTLQLVNSAFFRLSRPIADVEQAVIYLGLETILQVTLAVEVYQSHRGHPGVRGTDLDAFQEHAQQVGLVAAACFDDRRRQDEAFTTGLLHDVGRLIIATHLPDLAQRLADRSGHPWIAAVGDERDTLGVTHAEIGAYLLALWGLPYTVVEAVAHHHEPWNVEAQHLDMLVATYAADSLVHDVNDARAGRSQSSRLDVAYLDRLGLAARVEDWRDAATAIIDRHPPVAS